MKVSRLLLAGLSASLLLGTAGIAVAQNAPLPPIRANMARRRRTRVRTVRRLARNMARRRRGSMVRRPKGNIAAPTATIRCRLSRR